GSRWWRRRLISCHRCVISFGGRAITPAALPSPDFIRKVFADAHYWVALIDDLDQSNAAALAISQALQWARIVTTEVALTEVLAFFRQRGKYLRQLTVGTVKSLFLSTATRAATRTGFGRRSGFSRVLVGHGDLVGHAATPWLSSERPSPSACERTFR